MAVSFFMIYIWKVLLMFEFHYLGGCHLVLFLVTTCYLNKC